ncbi:MAG: hypothetical protein GDA56_20825 [Hormoscilla sp. GM7CHS1pb]|nr:hypothetical protein [Hormoscilla sp. GM7CHS1pb]
MGFNPRRARRPIENGARSNPIAPDRLNVRLQPVFYSVFQVLWGDRALDIVNPEK